MRLGEQLHILNEFQDFFSVLGIVCDCINVSLSVHLFWTCAFLGQLISTSSASFFLPSFLFASIWPCSVTCHPVTPEEEKEDGLPYSFHGSSRVSNHHWFSPLSVCICNWTQEDNHNWQPWASEKTKKIIGDLGFALSSVDLTTDLGNKMIGAEARFTKSYQNSCQQHLAKKIMPAFPLELHCVVAWFLC